MRRLLPLATTIVTLSKRSFMLGLALLFFVTSSATAMPPEQKAIFDKGIQYFDHATTDICTSYVSSSGNTAVLEGGSNAEIIWNWLRSQGLSEFQTAGVMGNIAVESGYSATRHEDGKAWSIGGWGLVQWTAGRRTAIANAIPADLKKYYADAYGDAIPEGTGGRHPDIPEEDNKKLLDFELTYMKQESLSRKVSTTVERQGYAERGEVEWNALLKQNSIEDAAVFWHNNFEVSSQSPEQVLATRLPRATEAFNSFSTGAVDNQGAITATTGCLTNRGATAGAISIIDTIKKFAWPYSTKGMSLNTEATAAYQEAAAQYFPIGGPNVLADCTYFVATTMRASGADPTFPVGTDAIYAYLLANTDKYEIIHDPKPTDLQPGDIVQHNENGSSSSGTWSGHILFYTGDLDGTGQYVGADASKYTRVPGYLEQNSINTMFGKESTIIARLK